MVRVDTSCEGGQVRLTQRERRQVKQSTYIGDDFDEEPRICADRAARLHGGEVETELHRLRLQPLGHGELAGGYGSEVLQTGERGGVLAPVLLQRAARTQPQHILLCVR